MMNLRFLKMPGCFNYVSNLKNPRKINQLQKLLGETFFPRISNIYTNVIQAIANQKNSYIASAMSSNLSKQIIKKRNQLNQNGYRIKNIQFQSTGVPLNTKSSHTWIAPGVSISVQSKVYFGQKFQPQKTDDQSFVVINTGPFRSFVFYKNQSILTSLKNFYNYQTYQFKAKIQSNDVLQVFDSANKPIYLQGNKGQDYLKSKTKNKRFVTQMIFKTGNNQFNWIITDINNIMKEDAGKESSSSK